MGWFDLDPSKPFRYFQINVEATKIGGQSQEGIKSWPPSFFIARNRGKSLPRLRKARETIRVDAE